MNGGLYPDCNLDLLQFGVTRSTTVLTEHEQPPDDVYHIACLLVCTTEQRQAQNASDTTYVCRLIGRSAVQRKMAFENSL